MKIVIRDAAPDDIPAIIETRTSVRENHLSVEEMAEMGITASTIRDALLEESCIWVAECNGAVVGFSMSDRDAACVFAVFVRPDWEGRGIGRRLLARAETFLSTSHDAIWLETAGVGRAAGFYERLGWVRSQALENGDVRFEKRFTAQASFPALRAE